ncbi:NAD(P)/FAD-dependent oxidoreductase [Hymenobacter properus]|uniref:NAD(P)/FAD-dependent oxidoreductase n=1 Tax=Hymenobacter properus TaxID=2791026 RepID=A0A931BHR3_9BACT|nr:NAD(P)/FAD-dependent oxidoreductase [Hymenobacter properus]MBF9141547.1 NAD(P)/FAD-dependent oxidoreductase [Hymenobacter properus]MBR7720356.1 NAD(P)/FAD-dependent oxidoreductase [Microvirga sp. SRT04]
MQYDVLIVGAGSAGLSAALTLGRCLRRVLLADGGRPRNECSPGVHGFLTRDGVAPDELLRLGHEQLRPYETVEVQCLRIESITRQDGGFRATGRGTADDAPFECNARRVLLATGVSDVLPPLPGFRELWGRGVLHCPYCHGWEVRNQPLAVFGQGRTVTGLALLVSRWSSDIVVVTNGPGHLTPNARRRLRRQHIRVHDAPIARLIGSPARDLKCIEFEDGSQLERAALFLHAPQLQRSALATDMGARLTSKGAVWVDSGMQTSIPRLYAAGDTTPGAQQALIAAAEGNRAAILINEGLTREECPK